MNEFKRSRVILGLSIAIITVVAILLFVLTPASQSQESIRQVHWVEVNPPPGVKGPCFGFYENQIGAGERLVGVWCN